MAKILKKEVKVGECTSVSEFFKYLSRDCQERQVLKDLQESEAEIKAGKGMVLKSLKDLR